MLLSLDLHGNSNYFSTVFIFVDFIFSSLFWSLKALWQYLSLLHSKTSMYWWDFPITLLSLHETYRFTSDVNASFLLFRQQCWFFLGSLHYTPNHFYKLKCKGPPSPFSAPLNFFPIAGIFTSYLPTQEISP